MLNNRALHPNLEIKLKKKGNIMKKIVKIAILQLLLSQLSFIDATKEDSEKLLNTIKEATSKYSAVIFNLDSAIDKVQKNMNKKLTEMGSGSGLQQLTDLTLFNHKTAIALSSIVDALSKLVKNLGTAIGNLSYTIKLDAFNEKSEAEIRKERVADKEKISKTAEIEKINNDLAFGVKTLEV